MLKPKQSLGEWITKLRVEISYEAKFFTEHKLFAALILFSILAATAFTLRPPNKKLIFLTGEEGTSYYTYGLKYKQVLQQKGVDVEIIKTKGSVENSRRLLDQNDEADAAFVMSGTIDPADASNIRTLGKLSYEPLWLFYLSTKRNDQIEVFTDLTGFLVNIGPKGSGTNLFSERLLKSVGRYNQRFITTLSTPQAIAQLAEGRINGIMTIDEASTENMKKLISIPNIRLASFKRADAYSDNIDHFDKIIIPMGSLDIAANFPPEDTPTVSTTTELLIKERLHPSHQLLLLETAQQIHSNKSTLTKAGEFPSISGKHAIMPSEEAKLFYRGDKPFLVDYLPYWVAEGISRIIFYLLPIAIVSYPIVREIWNYSIRRGRFKLEVIYTQLRQIEAAARKNINENERKNLGDKLHHLEQETLNLRIPQTIFNEYYLLRKHIDYVRESVELK